MRFEIGLSVDFYSLRDFREDREFVKRATAFPRNYIFILFQFKCNQIKQNSNLKVT